MSQLSVHPATNGAFVPCVPFLHGCKEGPWQLLFSFLLLYPGCIAPSTLWQLPLLRAPVAALYFCQEGLASFPLFLSGTFFWQFLWPPSTPISLDAFALDRLSISAHPSCTLFLFSCHSGSMSEFTNAGQRSVCSHSEDSQSWACSPKPLFELQTCWYNSESTSLTGCSRQTPQTQQDQN